MLLKANAAPPGGLGFRAPGRPVSRFPSSPKRGNGAPGEAPGRWRGVPGGQSTDARRAPRQSPVTRVCRFGARWSTDGGPGASPALHRGTRCRRPRPAPSSDAAIDDAGVEQGCRQDKSAGASGDKYFSRALPIGNGVSGQSPLPQACASTPGSSPDLTRPFMRPMNDASLRDFREACPQGCVGIGERSDAILDGHASA